MTLNLSELFFEKARTQPDQSLILGQETSTISYAGFSAEVRALATKLREGGVKSGDNIGLLHPSGREYIAFVYAIWACGACVTPLPVELTAAETQRIFQVIHMDAVIANHRQFDHIQAVVEPAANPLTAHTTLTKPASPCPPPQQLAQINAAFIRFTSGTTGDAKGVVLSHDSIYERIQAANQVLKIDENDRVLWLLSMDYHFAVSIVAYLTFGASIILPRNGFGITLLNAAACHQATIIYGSPTHYNMMLQDDSGAVLPEQLRFAIVTTTALRSEVASAFQERFGRVLNETYGIIELGLPAINVSNLIEKQGSVGRVLPAYELRLEGAHGEEPGEILLRSKGMLDAYYSPWTSRSAILDQSGGWFRTGDLGKLDADGFLSIVGRVKEMISVGGMKFFPHEVESVLESHPAVHAAYVFGVQEKQWGEAPVAHLVLEEGTDAPDGSELRAYCKQYLASHKLPGRFQWVGNLSYTPSGKKLRNPTRAGAINR